jgi:hypothetical protein
MNYFCALLGLLVLSCASSSSSVTKRVTVFNNGESRNGVAHSVQAEHFANGTNLQHVVVVMVTMVSWQVCRHGTRHSTPLCRASATTTAMARCLS